jgi:hypothetical protein
MLLVNRHKTLIAQLSKVEYLLKFCISNRKAALPQNVSLHGLKKLLLEREMLAEQISIR